jgi:predicted metalloprotease with PDZ domain
MKAVLAFVCALVAASTLHAETQEAGLEKEIRRLIGELGAQKYAMREAAQKQLLQLGDNNYEAVLGLSVRTFAATKDPEVKDRLRSIMASLVGAKIFDRPRGYLGIQVAQGTFDNEQQESVNAIAAVKPIEDGVAAKAGIQAGDLIVKIDELDLVKTPSTAEFINHVQSKRPGDKVRLVIRRGETVTTNDVVLGELPKDIQAGIYGEEARKEFFANWLDDQLKTLESQGRK